MPDTSYWNCRIKIKVWKYTGKNKSQKVSREKRSYLTKSNCTKPKTSCWWQIYLLQANRQEDTIILSNCWDKIIVSLEFLTQVIDIS